MPEVPPATDRTDDGHGALVVRPSVRWWHVVVFHSVYPAQWSSRARAFARDMLVPALLAPVAWVVVRRLLPGGGRWVVVATAATVLVSAVVRLGEPLYVGLTRARPLRVGSTDEWVFDAWGGRRSDGDVEIGVAWELIQQVDVVADVFCLRYRDVESAGFGAEVLPSGTLERLRRWHHAARRDKAAVSGPTEPLLLPTRRRDRPASGPPADGSWPGHAWSEPPVLGRRQHLTPLQRRALRRSMGAAVPYSWEHDWPWLMDDRGVCAAEPTSFTDVAWRGVERLHVTPHHVGVRVRDNGRPWLLSRDDIAPEDVDRIVAWAREAGVRVTGRGGAE